MPIKIELKLIPTTESAVGSDKALISQGSSGQARLINITSLAVAGSSAGSRLLCEENGLYYDQVVVIQDGFPTVTLQVV